MASKAASKRLGKEYVNMQKESPPYVWACPEETNILTWHYIIRGPPDSPYAGGEYHGVLLFPPEYPFKPPGIKMFTPSGRFQTDKRICFSMSDFHPGSWNPAWSVSTILTGLLSFMLSDEMTTGSVTSKDSDKHIFAAQSHSWNIRQKKFKEVFPDFCTPTPRDLPNMGERERGQSSEAEKVNPASPTPASPSSASNTPPSLAIHAIPKLHNEIPLDGSADSSLSRNTGPAKDVGSGWWFSSWAQVASERWRWGVVLLLAVVVSRISSSRQ
jgi:ubiquitin-conjugating enzyme E2 J2